MKTHSQPTGTPAKSPPPSKRRGIALITVLALLTLTSIIIIAFFSISQTELKSTTAYASGSEAQQLAKTAVDLVMHQIRSATEASGVAWASQPGMIRAWEKNGSQTTYSGFKLYSDDAMSVSSSSQNGFSTEVDRDFQDLSGWADDRNKDVFTDLNEPILRNDGNSTKTFYPILDPRAYRTGADKAQVTPSDWNPESGEDDEIEGFFFETSRVPRGDYPEKSGSKIDHYVGMPMPVKWIYQLEDGTMGTLSLKGPNTEFSALVGSGMPSKDNPIVARIAFWADDETSKLNINTAAGGRAWDTPRAGGKIDRDYGKKQPVQKEYQRYPGHPATTSINPVVFPNKVKFGQGAGYDRDAYEKIYEIVPRVEPGGSAGGQDNFTTDEPAIIEIDRDRLYATVDEFIFAPAKNGSMSELRKTHGKVGTWGEIDGEFLDKIKFFLTANSRAPEVTVFNTPRISA